MSARLAPEPALRPMQAADLSAVLGIEGAAYEFPWSRGNFIDSLAGGYLAEVLADDGGPVVGYYVALPGAGEMHLLNLTVAPERQGRGLARAMLDALQEHCRQRGLATLWLEVRASNVRARLLYRQRGMAEVGLRRGYYPAPRGAREDAVVMRLDLGPRAR